jgi:hypothetical protein
MPSGAVETFTGSNNAAPNATNWTLAESQGTGGGMSIQGNQLRIRTGTTSGNRSSVRLLTASRTDGEYLFDWVVPTQFSEFSAFWARSPTAGDTASGIYVSLVVGDMTVGYAETTNPYNGFDLTTYTHGFTAGQIVRTRVAVFTVSGHTTVKARSWLASGTENTSAWQINITDTHTTGSGYAVWTTSSGSTGSKDFFIDNVDAWDTETPSQATLFAAGGITPVGVAVKTAQKSFAGSITPAGALAKMRVVVRNFAGSITPTGVLVKIMPKAFGGGITPVGSMTKRVPKVFAGSVTPTATLLRQARRKFSGSITPVGAFTQMNLGRVFGRPGVVVMNFLQSATVTIRHRRG